MRQPSRFRLAQEEVYRIRKISLDVANAEQKGKELLHSEKELRAALTLAQGQQAEADVALKAAEEAARSEGSDPGVPILLFGNRQNFGRPRPTKQ